ncbi:hypothetical protein ABIG05_006042 [Bradyrhizobium japonicum]
MKQPATIACGLPIAAARDRHNGTRAVGQWIKSFTARTE